MSLLYAHMATRAIKEKWNFEVLFLLSGSNKFEKQFDLLKLAAVQLTWLVRIMNVDM